MSQIDYTTNLTPIVQNVYVLSGEVGNLSTEIVGFEGLDNSRIDILSTQNSNQDISLSSLSSWNVNQDTEIDEVWDAVIKVSSGQTTRYISDNNLSTLGGLDTWESYQDNPGGEKTTILFDNFQQIPLDPLINLSSIQQLSGWNWRGIQAPVQGITKKQSIDLRIRQNEYTGGNSYKGNIFISSRLGRWVQQENVVYWETHWANPERLPELESLLSLSMLLSADLSQAQGDRLVIQMGQVKDADHDRGVNLYVEDDTLSQWRFDPGTVTVSVASKADKAGVGHTGEIFVQDATGNLSQSGQYLSQSISIEPQSFDSVQQEQARTNIKAIGYDETNATLLTQTESREVCYGTNLQSQFYNQRRIYNFSANSTSIIVNSQLANINRFAALSSLAVANNNGSGAIYYPKLTQADVETLSTSFCGIELSLSGARIVQGDGQQSPTFTKSSFIDVQALGTTYILSIKSNLTLKSSTGQNQTLLNPQPNFQTGAIFFPLNIRNGTIGSTEYSIYLETDNSYVSMP